jgi:DNA-directed RNA polymerase specialized sigma24 family protein
MVLESERNRALWKAFAQLSERCQRLLRVVVVVSPPYEEAAAALEMPVGSIGPTRARCLARLRQNLVGGGINAEAGDSWL